MGGDHPHVGECGAGHVGGVAVAGGRRLVGADLFDRHDVVEPFAEAGVLALRFDHGLGRVGQRHRGPARVVESIDGRVDLGVSLECSHRRTNRRERVVGKPGRVRVVDGHEGVSSERGEVDEGLAGGGD